MTIDELETVLLGLLKGEYSSLSITFNEEAAPNYMSVEEYCAKGGDRHTAWVSDEAKQRGIQANRMWTAHWYPATPVGFSSLSADTLPALIQGILEESE